MNANAPPTTRRRTTRRSVFVFERLSRYLITAGGLGTILAVSLVFVFLLAVVLPLFLPASVKENARPASAAEWRARPPAHIGTDESMTAGWAYLADGTLEVFRLDTGASLVRKSVADGAVPTAASLDARENSATFGFADGTVRTGAIHVTVSSVDPKALPEALRDIAPGTSAPHGDAILERTPDGKFRRTSLELRLEDPLRIEPPAKVLLVDCAHQGDNARLAAITEDGRLILRATRQRENQMTGEVTRTVTAGELRLPQLEGREPPQHLLLSGVGDSTYVAWADGLLVRVDTRDVEAPAVVEVLDLLPEPAARLTALQFMIGRTTLVVGDSLGRVRGWFRIKPDDAGTGDGAILVKVHELEPSRSAVTAIATSQRSRVFAAAYENGEVRVFQMTTGKTMAETSVPSDAPLQHLAFSPKDDGLVGANGRSLPSWRLDAQHPEITVRSAFFPVWYEGYTGPTATWQSSGSDAFEPKFGFWPLIFGTIKATFYSLLFGAPLAILAALFTSEFLAGKTRSRVKPVIEMMASLPSVVLGFLAAVVIAPYVASIVPQFLSCFVTIPFAMLLGANMWQALPGQGRTGRLRPWRAPFLFVMCAAGVGLGFLVGPVVERGLFEGDIKGWLDGAAQPARVGSPAKEAFGTPTGGWMFPMLPVAAVLVAVAMSLFVNPALRRVSRDWGAGAMARVELAKFLLGFVAVVVVALALSWLMGLSWDPRGSFVGTYDKLNAMVVGFLMGFAIIPIIYTISEDALSGVPEHLRAASLGCGATAWQTAIRIVLPTALSGIFSALMVGFGRAVGETMIVVMAAGSTPVLDWNVFNGFRTLSANIATEMPEATQGSTHYRTLFLAALVLFAMTFLVNSVAEAVRQRVRRRAYEL